MSKTKYKLVDKEGYTRRGKSGETYWLDGVEKIASGRKYNRLCTSDVIHYYEHPLLAALFNPLHANIKGARLIEIEIDGEAVHDGLKGGCKRAKYVKEIDLPHLTTVQRVTFAIKISLTYYKNAEYEIWAKNWLSGKDRTGETAVRAESAARAAWVESAARATWAESTERAESAARAAASAARAAERAARAAARAAWAAWAASAVESAESAARAAACAASAVESAESAASAASAESAESVEKINKLFIKTITEIVPGGQNEKMEKGNN